MNLADLKTDKTWTLFLDRDGVINRKIECSYVLKWQDFRFIKGVKPALKKLSCIFGKIIVVTNQQCIGKGLLTEQEILAIHKKMLTSVEKAGGRIDHIYYSPEIEENRHIRDVEKSTRKPGTRMGWMAKSDFPEIDFKKSIMAGDSISDMVFGKKLGMVNVLISNVKKLQPELKDMVHFQFSNLEKFSRDL